MDCNNNDKSTSSPRCSGNVFSTSVNQGSGNVASSAAISNTSGVMISNANSGCSGNVIIETSVNQCSGSVKGSATVKNINSSNNKRPGSGNVQSTSVESAESANRNDGGNVMPGSSNVQCTSVESAETANCNDGGNVTSTPQTRCSGNVFNTSVNQSSGNVTGTTTVNTSIQINNYNVVDERCSNVNSTPAPGLSSNVGSTSMMIGNSNVCSTTVNQQSGNVSSTTAIKTINSNNNNSSNVTSTSASGSVGNVICTSNYLQKYNGNVPSTSKTEHSGNVCCTSTVANESIANNTFIYSNDLNIKAVVPSKVLNDSIDSCNNIVDMIDLSLSSEEQVQSIRLGTDFIPNVLTKWMNKTSPSKKCFMPKSTAKSSSRNDNNKNSQSTHDTKKDSSKLTINTNFSSSSTDILAEMISGTYISPHLRGFFHEPIDTPLGETPVHTSTVIENTNYICIDTDEYNEANNPFIYVSDSEVKQPNKRYTLSQASPKLSKHFVSRIDTKVSIEYNMSQALQNEAKGFLQSISTKSSKPNDVINTIHCKSISLQSIDRLMNNQWLDDETINFMFQIFCLRSHIISTHMKNEPDWFMNSYFTSYLLGREAKDYNYASVSRWKKRSPFPNFFHKYRRIFFPVNYNKCHWFLIMVDFFKNEIVTFDSIPSNRFDKNNTPGHKIFEFMKELASDQDHKQFRPGIWTVFDSREKLDKFQISTQHDCVSCGLYVIAHAELLSFKYRKFQQSAMELFRFISDEKIAQKKYRSILLAIIINYHPKLFDKKHVDNFENPKLPSHLKHKLSNNNSNKSSSFTIDREPANKDCINSFAIEFDINKEDFVTDANTFTDYNVINKVAYLLKPRSQFHECEIHHHLVDDDKDLYNKKVQAAKSAMCDAVVEFLDGKNSPANYKKTNKSSTQDRAPSPQINNEYDDDDDDDEDSYMQDVVHNIEDATYNPSSNSDNNVDKLKVVNARLFVNELKNNPLFDMGFRVYSKSSRQMTLNKNCICPCSQKCSTWHKMFDLDFLENQSRCSSTKTYEPYALYQHCESLSKTCVYHYLTKRYLYHLYNDWWVTLIKDKRRFKSHYGLFPPNHKNAKKGMELLYQLGPLSTRM